MDTKITDKLCTHAFWVSVIGVVICSSYGLSPFRSPTITITKKTCCPLDIYEQISGELKSVESKYEDIHSRKCIWKCRQSGNHSISFYMRSISPSMMTSSNGNIFVNSPHKGQWRRALMFSLICAWINAWVNNSEAADLRRLRAHYDVIVMHLGDRYWMLMYSSTR